jgi:hypothetical protein
MCGFCLPSINYISLCKMSAEQRHQYFCWLMVYDFQDIWLDSTENENEVEDCTSSGHSYLLYVSW